jgi:hypothetical protein
VRQLCLVAIWQSPFLWQKDVPKQKSQDPPLDHLFRDLPIKNEKHNSTKKEI